MDISVFHFWYRNMKTKHQPNNIDLKLLHQGRLTPREVLRVAYAVKVFVRKHRRRDYRWCWRELGISKRQFTRFFAIGKWSKKVRELISANTAPLSQTVLFKLADQSWKDSRQLFNKLQQVIRHLSWRKRRTLEKLKAVVDSVSMGMAAVKENPLKKKHLVKYKAYGKVETISTPFVEQTRKWVEGLPGFQYLIHPLV